MFQRKKKKTQEVFGMSNSILVDSYIDRGNLDEEIQRLLGRTTHIALRGESKCGKSWLRQRNIPDSLVVQCRFRKTVIDIYTDALSQLGIKLTIEQSSNSTIKGRIEAETSVGINLLFKLGVKSSIEGNEESGTKASVVGQDINDLRFIADIFISSGRRLIVEDFHYLSMKERTNFAFDLKALWDYGCFVVIIGVWSQSNLLSYINSDLSGRIIEKSIYWSNPDLDAVINKGASVLKMKFCPEIQKQLVENCFGNVGLLQQLILFLLDESNIFEEQNEVCEISNLEKYLIAATKYADQLDAVYLQFAKRVSTGIRNRRDSTGIYVHAVAAILESDDSKLLNGLKLDEIYRIAHARQPRIQSNNLKTILRKFEELQVDDDGRGLVIAFNESNDEITAVDRQLLFYRKYFTAKWPWENVIEELLLETESGVE